MKFPTRVGTEPTGLADAFSTPSAASGALEGKKCTHPIAARFGGQGRGEPLGRVRQENFRRFARFGNEGENRLIVVYLDRRTRTMFR
jgi:hypothetical protein